MANARTSPARISFSEAALSGHFSTNQLYALFGQKVGKCIITVGGHCQELVDMRECYSVGEELTELSQNINRLYWKEPLREAVDALC